MGDTRRGLHVRAPGLRPSQRSWATPLIAIALIAFFVLVLGPLADWVLAKCGSQAFDAGLELVDRLPGAYLMLTIAIVAPIEELLYRGYAITRLSELTGSYLLASIASVIACSIAHVPMWGVGTSCDRDRFRRHCDPCVPVAPGYACLDHRAYRHRSLRDRASSAPGTRCSNLIDALPDPLPPMGRISAAAG
jgi:membrane protease YdiL (CAAX protease family)